MAPVEAAIESLAPPIQLVVEPVTATAKHVRNAVAFDVEALGAARMTVVLGAFGATIEPFVNALAAHIKALIDAVPADVQTLLDAISAVESVRGCERRRQQEGDWQKSRDAHGGTPWGCPCKRACRPGDDTRPEMFSPWL